MVEQMVCKRDKAHCSPIRRRFLTLVVAALLLTTTEAQTEGVPWSKRTKTSVLVARRDRPLVLGHLDPQTDKDTEEGSI